MFRFLDTSRASSYIKKIRGFYKVAAFNPVAILKQWATKEEQKNDEGRELLAKEAGDALAKLDAEGQQYGFANISIVVYGSTPEECEDATRQVVGVIGNAGLRRHSGKDQPLRVVERDAAGSLGSTKAPAIRRDARRVGYRAAVQCR